MSDFLFHLIAVIVAVVAIFRGYRHGLLRQTVTLLGIAFAAVCCRVMADGGVFDDRWLPGADAYPLPHFFCGVVGGVVTAALVMGLFWLVNRLVTPIFAVIPSGILNSISGAVVALYTGWLVLSMAYNLLLALHPTGPLLKYGEQDDGNLCEAVLMVAPATFGFDSVKDLAHAIQMQEAKKISYESPGGGDDNRNKIC